MTIPAKPTDRELFCLKYLLGQGYFPDDVEAVKMATDKLKEKYVLVRLDESFFTELAEQLRILWPPGEKDGKYPWRDSVPNLAKRLETLWKLRRLERFTKDDCLRVARKYLAQFQDDRKYMCILNYFILKQNTITQPNGKKRLINQSKLADMLENDVMNLFEEMEESDIPELHFEEELV